MEIVSAKVRWMHGYVNTPELEIVFEEEPLYGNLRWREVEQYMYLGLDGKGFASHLYYKQPGEGFGGRRFPIIMEDGSERELVGPWSSGASAFNALGIDPQIMDVAYTWKTSPYKYTMMGGSVTLEVAQAAIQHINDVRLYEHPVELRKIGHRYVPAFVGYPVKGYIYEATMPDLDDAQATAVVAGIDKPINAVRGEWSPFGKEWERTGK